MHLRSCSVCGRDRGEHGVQPVEFVVEPRRRASGRLDPSPLVTHHMPLADAAEAYALYDRREALKIVLNP